MRFEILDNFVLSCLVLCLGVALATPRTTLLGRLTVSTVALALVFLPKIFLLVISIVFQKKKKNYTLLFLSTYASPKETLGGKKYPLREVKGRPGRPSRGPGRPWGGSLA